MRLGFYHVLFVSLFVLWTAEAFAQKAVPVPPCGVAAAPAYSPPDSPPAIAVLHREELAGAAWRTPSCTGWPDSFSPARLVVLAGQFRFDGDVSELMARTGAVSALRGIRYWSMTENRWRPLVYDSAALSGPEPNTRRNDFTPEEMMAGTRRYYWVDDSRLGGVVYEQAVLARGPDRAVIATRNATAVKFLFMTLFAPGELRSTVFVEKLSPGVWGLYSMMGTSASGWLLEGGDAAFVNRAVALFRHAAGIPTDREPPGYRASGGPPR